MTVLLPVDGLERELLAVDRAAVGELVSGALGQGASPHQVVDELLVPALDRIGAAWEAGHASLSQVYMAGRIVEELTARFAPDAPAGEGQGTRVALGVLEDQHVLGKRMVAAHLRAAGATVLDLGAALSPADFAARAAGEGAAVVMVSTLLLRSALAVETLVGELRARGSAAPVIVGGAPFRLDPGLWRKVGADGFGRSAAEAPALAGLGRRP